MLEDSKMGVKIYLTPDNGHGRLVDNTWKGGVGGGLVALAKTGWSWLYKNREKGIFLLQGMDSERMYFSGIKEGGSL